MPIDFQQVINSPFAPRFAALLARAIPPRMGYWLCDQIGSWVAKHRDSKLTQTVRCHQSMVHGRTLEPAALDQTVRETLQNNARDIYNLYHFLHNLKAVQKMIHFSPEAYEVVQRPEFADRGLVVLGIHLSNFDLVLRSIFQQGLKAMVLTIPDPHGGRRVEYEMRRQIGMNMVPASIGGLRSAVKHLENGGMVITGADRPIPQPRQLPGFFGRPAALPTHYVYLASKARVPVVVMATIQQPDGMYHVFRSPSLEMEDASNSQKEPLRNAERVLKQVETFIRQAPRQWNVPLPIWPDLLN